MRLRDVGVWIWRHVPLRRVAMPRAFAAGLACAGIAAGSAAADDFYKGKALTIVVGYSPGGGFDASARLLARTIGRHIPGQPNVIVQNLPGAAGLNSIAYLENVAPRDGTVIDIFNFGSIGDSRLMPEKIKLDFRNFNWIGSTSEDLTVCYVWHTFGPRTLAELVARPVVHMGLTAVGSSSDVNQRILRNVFGVRVQQIAGYPGSAEERLAIERGELDGNCGAWGSIPPEWISTRRIVPIIRSAPSAPDDLPASVPYSVDIADGTRARGIVRFLVASGELGRPFIASRAVPPERIRILRDAFNAAVRDPQFRAEAQKLRLPVSPRTGEEALRIVTDIYATPDEIVQAARKIASE